MTTASMLAAMLATFAPQQGGAMPAEPAPTRVELPPNETIRIHGTAVAVDEAGTEHAHEDGLLRLAQWPTGLFEVPVRDGKFEATVVAGAKLLMPRLQLASRSVELRLVEVVANADGSIDLRGPWEGDLDLKVVDATTKTELTDCEWIHDPSFRILVDVDGRRSLAGESGNHVASPLKLAQAGRYWVRAPGHAWQLFLFDDSAAGSHEEATLALPKACVLDVVLPEPKEKERAWLVVDEVPDEGATPTKGTAPTNPYSSGKRPLRWYARRGASEAIRLESLPPGRWLARAVLDLELHPWFPIEVPFASAMAEVAPDRENRLVIARGAIPAGLHEDGTVDRTGVVTIAGAKPGSPGPKSGTLEAGFGVRDVFQRDGVPRRGGGGINRITRDGIESSLSPPLEVVDGKVHLRCPFGSLLWIGEVTLDGVEYPLNGHELVADTTTEPFSIEIPGLESLGGPTTILHVVDKETRAELQHVSIAPYDFDRPRELRFVDHPGSVRTERLVVADGTSPVRLRDPTGRKGLAGLHVRAAGYAWTKFQHDWSKPAERTIELERACDLSITLEPSIDAAGMVIEVSRLKEREAVIEQYQGFLARFLDEKGSVVHGNERSVSSLRSDIAELESSDFALALIRASGLPCAREAPARSGATRIEGVPLGRLAVALRNPKSIQSPIGFTLVDATAGGEIPVSIRIPPNALRAAVPLAGTATIPREWGATKAEIQVIPVGALASSLQPSLKHALTPVDPDDSKGERFTWDAGTVLPGTYRLSVELYGPVPHDARHACRIEVKESGETNAQIEFPKPCDVQIDVIDDATGAPVFVQHFSWEPLDDADATTSSSTFVSSEIGKDGSLRFRCPAERIRLWIHDGRLIDRQETFELASPSYHGSIRIERHGGIHLRWLQGTQPAKPDLDYFVTLYAIAADGSATEVDLDDWFSEWIPVPKPGRYRVAFAIEDDEEEGEDESSGIEPVDVIVPSDTIVDVDVQLPQPKKKDG
jgi:hypothetical protein